MKYSFTLFLLALITTASVAQWSEQTSGVTTTLYSVSPVDNNVVWACGAGGKVLRTVNGGTNWSLTATPNAALALYNIWGVDANTAIVTGSSTTGYVYKTTNAGANWTLVFSQTGGFIDAIASLNTNNSNMLFMYGDPVGGRWSLWQSSDVGSTWDSTGWYVPQAGSEAGYNNSVFVHTGDISDVRIWFGTSNTRVYKMSNSGIWSQPTPGQANSLAIAFVDTVLGFVGGSTGLLHTSNGGNIWSDLPGIPGTGSVNGIVFGNMVGELFISRGTTIYQTTSFGVNWITSNTATGTYTHMLMARAQDNHNIWAVRNNGGISKYTYPIGIKPISGEVPESYALYQNYPNPFNPVTKIRFDLPKSAFTELKIYDNLGREISAIISGRLTTGKYEVSWDASNQPSGVYYYKLTSGDFSVTKKMILLK